MEIKVLIATFVIASLTADIRPVLPARSDNGLELFPDATGRFTLRVYRPAAMWKRQREGVRCDLLSAEAAGRE